MIHLIEQATSADITALNFVERYGGRAIPVSAKFEAGGGDDPSFPTKTYPVSSQISEKQCFEGGKYLNLVPNEQYKSVAYLEQTAGASGARSDFTEEGISITETVRFVCWLNMRKLGIDNTKGTFAFEAAAIKALFKEYNTTIEGVSVSVDPVSFRIVNKNPRAVFGQYSYSNIDWAFFWPFDYFAIDFTFRVLLDAGCLEDVTLGNEISCLTNW